MSKKLAAILSVLFAAAAVVSPHASAPQASASAQSALFSDIAGSVHKDGIDWLTREAPLTANDGFLGSEFRPYTKIATADFKDWLGRVDTSASDLTAAQGELPSTPSVTRLQAAYAMAAFFDLPAATSTSHGFNDLTGYTTADHRTVWAVKAAGIMFGVTSTTFKPDALLKRGQAASIPYRGFKPTVTDPDDPCGDGFIPKLDGYGKVTVCLSVGDCPFDEYSWLEVPDGHNDVNYPTIWLGKPKLLDSVATTHRRRAPPRHLQVADLSPARVVHPATLEPARRAPRPSNGGLDLHNQFAGRV